MSDTTHDPWKDEAWLREKYCGDGLSIQEIADSADTTFDTVRYYMRKHGVERWDANSDPNERYKDAEFLRTQYWKHDKSLSDIGDMCDVKGGTILYWMKKNDVEREVPDQDKGSKWKDADRLERLYWDEGLTLEEMATRFGCSESTVVNWMKRYGIERHKTPDQQPPNHRWTRDGYEQVRTKINQQEYTIGIHRLVAYAEGILSGTELLNGEKHVHHKNGVPWDNRPENLEAMTESNHHAHHYKEIETDSGGKFTKS